MDNPTPTLLIGFAGDVMLGRLVNEQIKNTDYNYVWGDVLPTLKSTDLNIINLETAITRHSKAVLKTFNFKTDPEHVAVLRIARIDAVNLANNHVLDFDIPGLTDTLLMLKKEGIAYAGAGVNLDEATRPAILLKNDLRVALFGFTDNEPGWKAGKNSAGINHIKVGEIAPVKSAIAEVKDQVDLVVISIHWGPNMREVPTEQFIDFAHKIIDSGADIIHGHSAHIFQGIECYRGKLILYDTGDFVDDYRVDPDLKNDHSFLFLCEAGRRSIRRLKLLPVRISNMQVNLANNNESRWSINRMRQLCAHFNTSVNNKGEVEAKWG